MAQMPKGQPRSVPDPVGEEFDAMLQREKQKRQRLEQLASKPTSSAEAEYFSNFHLPDFSRQAPPRDPTIEREERRQALERVSYMVDHPLAGVAYGLASLINASPSARDRALMAGGAADTVMMGAAPLGASVRGRPTPVQRQPEVPNMRDAIRYGELNNRKQATGATASVAAPMLGSGTRADRRQAPPGWQGNGTTYNEARGHLIANQLGGLGDEPRNLVTLTHQGANTPQMSNFERGVARRARAGEVIEYSSLPLYGDKTLRPEAVLVTALGSRGAPSAAFIPNPARRRR